MRNKQVEFNPYIYTLSKLYRFGYEISVFLIQNTWSLFYGRHYSSLHRLMSLNGKMDVKIFLMFIVAENTRSVNITYWKLSFTNKALRNDIEIWALTLIGQFVERYWWDIGTICHILFPMDICWWLRPEFCCDIQLSLMLMYSLSSPCRNTCSWFVWKTMKLLHIDLHKSNPKIKVYKYFTDVSYQYLSYF